MISNGIAYVTSTFGLGRTEAEDFDIKEGLKVQSNGAASGGATLQATGTASAAAAAFAGPAGTYDLTIGYFDETDGASSLDVVVNGVVVDTFVWDSTAGAAIANKASLAERVIPNLALAPGDTLELRGAQDGGEPLRTDYIELAAASAPPPPPPDGTGFMVEAEDLTIEQGFKVQSNGAASGGAMLQDDFVVGTLGVFTAVASYIVPQTGAFDLQIDYFDETDGVSNLSVLVNGASVGDFLFDDLGGSTIANAASRASLTIPDLALAAGDVLTLQGNGDAGEPLRIDKLSFEPSEGMPPPPPPMDFFVVEAEDLTIVSGFKVQSNGAASGGAMLQDNAASGPSTATYTVTDTGVFDLTIGYFDEADGVSSLDVLVNGVTVDSFDWDDPGGSTIANAGSAVQRVILGLDLEAGDVIELSGMGDGGEPLRIDFLRFDPGVAMPPPPPPFVRTPDFWFVDQDNDEITVALNNSFGDFTEVETGINAENFDVLDGDFNGDGFTDFVRVEAVGLPVPFAGDSLDRQEFAITVYLNNDNATFTAQPVQSVFNEVPAGRTEPISFFLADVGDIDGDGDLDLLGTGAFDDFDQFLFTFENDGFGTFVPETTSPAAEFGVIDVPLLADLNGDDTQDVIVFNSFPEAGIFTYINNGEWQFEILAEEFGINESVFNFQIIDLDLDGDLDAIYHENGENRGIYGFINDGTGQSEEGFGPSIFGDETGLIGSSVAGDFDGDGGVEIVTAGAFDSDDNPEGLRVFDVVDFGGGDVEFVLKSTDTSIVGNVTGFEDFDLDGDLDLLITQPSTFFLPDDFPVRDPGLGLLLNDGAGNFTDAGIIIPPFDSSDFGSVFAEGVAFFDDMLL